MGDLPPDQLPGESCYPVSPARPADEDCLCSRAMTNLTKMTATTALDRLSAWQVALRAENESRHREHLRRLRHPVPALVQRA